MRIDSILRHSFLADRLGPGDVVVDVGMNRGAFAAAVRRRYGCRVVGLEPVPALHAALPEVPGVTAEPRALTAAGTRVRLHVNAATDATVVAGLAEDGAPAVEVEATTLRDLLDRHGIERAALVKLDAEGAELEVLEHADADTLRRIDQLSVEFHDFLDPGQAPAVRRVAARLRREGFAVLRFSRGWSDVLFVNRARRPIGALEGAWLLARYKYPAGAARMAGRLLGRGPGADPERLQHDFYTATAHSYDAEMVGGGEDPHSVALETISALIDGHGWRSVLDVGAGTGRGVRHFARRHPGLEVRGVEPVPAMIEAARRAGAPAGSIVEGRGEALPFPDGAFDAVCELGILHHVADPEAVVREMRRVARRAVFLSDENRFANGPRPWRLAKLALHRAGIWPAVWRLANRGRPYHLSAGDGAVVYSYSVYDSLPGFRGWADRAFVVPTVPALHPLLGARNALLCALRDR